MPRALHFCIGKRGAAFSGTAEASLAIVRLVPRNAFLRRQPHAAMKLESPMRSQRGREMKSRPNLRQRQ